MAINLPSTYDVRFSGTEGRWYHLQQLLEFVNATYRLNWTAIDLVNRFGLEAEAAPRVKCCPLKILEYSLTGFHVRTYSLAMMPDIAFGNGTYFVPAEWVEGYLLISLDQGARQLRIYKGGMVVCAEDNKVVLCW